MTAVLAVLFSMALGVSGACAIREVLREDATITPAGADLRTYLPPLSSLDRAAAPLPGGVAAVPFTPTAGETLAPLPLLPLPEPAPVAAAEPQGLDESDVVEPARRPSRSRASASDAADDFRRARRVGGNLFLAAP